MRTDGTTTSYTHRDLGETINAIGGYYRFEKESCLFFGGLPVLYLVGYGVLDSSCCGMGGCTYAYVIGYVVDWKTGSDADGFAISGVTEIADPQEQRQIAAEIQKKEGVQQVLFA